MTPVEVLLTVSGIGGRLASAGHRLGMLLPMNCVPELKQTIREHKWDLQVLLGLRFVMVASQTLGETIFFCEDEDTKAELVEAGAEPTSVYTCDELRALVAHHRVQPFTAAELIRLHQAKRIFSGRFID